MSEWSAPTAPVSSDYRTPRAGFGVLVARLRKIESAVRALQQSAPLRSAGIFLADLGMTINSSLTVVGDLFSTGNADITGTTHIGGATDIDGTLNVDAATTIGGTLGVTGVTTLGGATSITGNTTVTGTLGVTGATTLGSTLALSGNGTVTGNLQSSNFVAGASGWRLTSTGLEVNTLTAKDAIIGNQALTSPVTALIGPSNKTTGWAGTTGYVTRASTAITVPAGFTQAQVTALGMVVFFDPSINSFYARTTIHGTAGEYIHTLANTTGSASPNQTLILTGLTGGTVITLQTQILCGVASAAQAANQAVVSGSAIFFR